MKPLYIEVLKDKIYIKEKNFEVKISRMVEMPLEQIKKMKDKFGTNSFCPPGEFFVFYRLRKNGDRLELCSNKPKKLFTWNHKQGVLFSPNGTKRTNIQIHLGKKSKGCILIDESQREKYFELLKIVADELSKKRDVKIIVDDAYEFYVNDK